VTPIDIDLTAVVISVTPVDKCDARRQMRRL
jgi:hypothetical protein